MFPELKRLHESEYCFECDKPITEEHHLIFGKNHQNAEDFGLTCRLCPECHRRLHDKDEQMAMRYRKMGQVAFEYKFGHEEFMRVFGRNYL